MKKQEVNRTLKVAFPVARKSLSYEPTNIRLGYEYIFLENIFSTLVEMDTKGVLQPGVAEKAEWINNELRLTIPDGIRTASGLLIDASDVLFSLKRLLVLSGNTHGNFKDLICPGAELKSIEDECKGLRQEGRYIFLSVGERKPFLLPMLAAIDFAIIPKSSCDPKTLEIINLRETSGPYYVASDDGAGNIELQLNPHHFHASQEIADKVLLVPMDPKNQRESIQALLDNRVDLLTTVDTSKADDLIPLAESHPEYSLHTTMKIRTIILVFTERGQRELSLPERKYISEKVRGVFAKLLEHSPGYERQTEFFPALSEGGLSKSQQESLEILNGKASTVPQKNFRLGIMKRGAFDTWADPIRVQLPQADCYLEQTPPDLQKDIKPENMPHAFIASTDTGFMEDISLISFSLNAGFLGLPKKERDKWLATYMSMDNRTERIAKLKDLHFNALRDFIVVPTMASPYASLVRKPWRMEFSDLFANNQLWLIKIQ